MTGNQVARLLIACVSLVATLMPPFVMGRFDGFVIWNMFPSAAILILLIPWTLLENGQGTVFRYPVWMLVGAFVTSAFSLAFQVSWHFDLGGTATASSTAALAFIFVPIWAIVFGAAAAFVTFAATAIARRSRTEGE